MTGRTQTGAWLGPRDEKGRINRLAGLHVRMIASISAVLLSLGESTRYVQALSYPPPSFVQFGHREAVLSERGQQEVAGLARYYCSSTIIMWVAIDGYSDPDELKGARDRGQLAWQRSQAVASALVQKGVKRGHLVVTARDGDEGVSERSNRVVWLRQQYFFSESAPPLVLCDPPGAAALGKG